MNICLLGQKKTLSVTKERDKYSTGAKRICIFARFSPKLLSADTAGLLTYGEVIGDHAKACLLGKSNGDMLSLPEYSSGGCPGFEPDSLLIYSAYSFSNRIPIQLKPLYNYYSEKAIK